MNFLRRVQSFIWSFVIFRRQNDDRKILINMYQPERTIFFQ